MWCWRRMEKISWTDHVRNEEVLLRVNLQRNILHEIRKRKANWVVHILRRNCLLKQVIEGKRKGEMEVTRRRGRRRRKLLDDLKDRRGCSYLKVEALTRTMWRNHFGRGFGPVVRQNTEWTTSPSRVCHTFWPVLRPSWGMSPQKYCIFFPVPVYVTANYWRNKFLSYYSEKWGSFSCMMD